MGNCFLEKTEAFFKTLPDNKDLPEALRSLTLEDPDGIRELALKLMPPKGEERHEFLRQIFDLSSNFCPIPLEPEERLDAIHRILREH